MAKKTKDSVLKVIVDRRLKRKHLKGSGFFTNRIENSMLDSHILLLYANISRDLEERLNFQIEEGRKLMIVDELLQIAFPSGLLTIPQFEQISKLLAQTRQSLKKWYSYTKKEASTARDAD